MRLSSWASSVSNWTTQIRCESAHDTQHQRHNALKLNPLSPSAFNPSDFEPPLLSLCLSICSQLFCLSLLVSWSPILSLPPGKTVGLSRWTLLTSTRLSIPTLEKYVFWNSKVTLWMVQSSARWSKCFWMPNRSMMLCHMSGVLQHLVAKLRSMDTSSLSLKPLHSPSVLPQSRRRLSDLGRCYIYQSGVYWGAQFTGCTHRVDLFTSWHGSVLVRDAYWPGLGDTHRERLLYWGIDW